MIDHETGEYIGESPAPLCGHCTNKATCYGRYEGFEGFSCDVHCGHGNEDGVCHKLDSPEETEVFETIWGTIQTEEQETNG